VGGGLAGLYAGWLLKRRGDQVILLEAGDRLGGRVWSDRLADGTVVERGGEFIGVGDSGIRVLANELGLTLIPHGFDFSIRKYPNEDSTPNIMELRGSASRIGDVIARHIAASSQDDIPLAGVLDHVGSDRTTSYVLEQLETTLTVPLAGVSARWFHRYISEWPRYGEAFRIAGGNEELVRALASDLQGNIATQRTVKSVAHSKSGVEVGVEGHEPLIGDAIIVAVPLPLLWRIEFDPGLPNGLYAELSRFVIGDAAKLHVGLRDRDDAQAIQVPGDRWWSWTSLANRNGRSGTMAVSAFAGGEAVIRRLEVSSGSDMWRQALERLCPGFAMTQETLLTQWSAQPWIGGSYCAPAAGWSPRSEKILARPVDRLVLAGEYTAGAHMRSMAGALESALRAVTDVVELKSAP